MKKSFKNKIRDLVIIIFIIVLTFELSPYIISPIINKQPFSRKQIKNELYRQYKQQKDKFVEDEENNSKNEYLGDHILHPYIGFVNIPNKNYNKFCFYGPDPITQASPDRVNICLMGGSVAMELYKNSKGKLINNLKHTEFFKDKEINIVLFALGGFKQPQQLMALNYFLSLGAQYDIVINLDGFNEIVLPFSDNLPFKVYPSYPRHWNIYSRKRLNTKVQLLMAKQLTIKKEQFNLNKFFIETPFHYCNFGLFLWNVLNNDKKTYVFQAEEQLRKAVSLSKSDYQSTGPEVTFTDTTRFFEEQAKLWERTSFLIGKLGESIGFDYFHFLQPNQYYEGSKNLTKEELEIAYEHADVPYKTAVKIGYPILINHGKELVNKGINFYDLTLMFKNEKRTVYYDKCCHFNELGYDLITDKISEYIINLKSISQTNTEIRDN